MKKTIINFLNHSYHSDKLAFYLELISLIITFTSSLTLALTAKSPDMILIYPGFFVGSISATIAYYRRKLIWSMILTGYFAVINLIGFFVALG